MGDEEMGIQMGLGEGVLSTDFSWRSIVGWNIRNICFLRASLVEGQKFQKAEMGHLSCTKRNVQQGSLWSSPQKRDYWAPLVASSWWF